MAEVEYDTDRHRRFVDIGGILFRVLKVFDSSAEARAYTGIVKPLFDDVVVEAMHSSEYGVLVRPHDRYPKEVG